MSLPNCGRLYQVETLAGKLLTPHSLPLAMPSKKDSMIPQAAPMNPLLGNFSNFYSLINRFLLIFVINL